MTQVKILTNQSILDFCLQTCGSAEALFDVMKLNSLNDLMVTPLIELNVPDLIKNQRVVDFYKNNNITPGSEYSLLTDDFDNNDFDPYDFG
jgi:hypothetical protein